MHCTPSRIQFMIFVEKPLKCIPEKLYRFFGEYELSIGKCKLIMKLNACSRSQKHLINFNEHIKNGANKQLIGK